MSLLFLLRLLLGTTTHKALLVAPGDKGTKGITEELDRGDISPRSRTENSRFAWLDHSSAITSRFKSLSPEYYPRSLGSHFRDPAPRACQQNFLRFVSFSSPYRFPSFLPFSFFQPHLLCSLSFSLSLEKVSRRKRTAASSSGGL